MRLRYNSPVILTYALVATAVTMVDTVVPRFSGTYFAVGHPFVAANPLSWFRLVSHCVGHAGWGHLFQNCTMLLLIGPILEEKYGSADLLTMMLVTAFVTGMLNMALFPSTLLLGASGIVFMLIILASFSNFRGGEIPLTFVLVALLFLGAEVVRSFERDQISQFAHILGGISGACFGFQLERRRGFAKKG